MFGEVPDFSMVCIQFGSVRNICYVNSEWGWTGIRKFGQLRGVHGKGFVNTCAGDASPTSLRRSSPTWGCGHIPLMPGQTVRSRSQRRSPGAVFVRVHTERQVAAEKALVRARSAPAMHTEQQSLDSAREKEILTGSNWGFLRLSQPRNPKAISYRPWQSSVGSNHPVVRPCPPPWPAIGPCLKGGLTSEGTRIHTSSSDVGPRYLMRKEVRQGHSG